jgi:integrase
VESGIALIDGSATVAEFVDRWLEQITPQRSPTTIRGYTDKAKRTKADLGHLKINKLSSQRLDRAYRAWLEEGINPNTVHHIHAVLSAALHQGVKWGVVPRAVTQQASPPPLRVRPKEALDPAVVRQLISAAETSQPVLSAAIKVAATTGLRRGELCGLHYPVAGAFRVKLRRGQPPLGRGKRTTVCSSQSRFRRPTRKPEGAVRSARVEPSQARPSMAGPQKRRGPKRCHRRSLCAYSPELSGDASFGKGYPCGGNLSSAAQRPMGSRRTWGDGLTTPRAARSVPPFTPSVSA